MTHRTGVSAPHIDLIGGIVHQTIPATLTASGTTVDSFWLYDRSEPWSIHLSVATGGVRVRWLFDRELLSRGLDHWAGSGDVRIGPGPGRGRGPRTTVIHLVARRTVVPALLDTHALEAFLRATTRLIGLGQESRGIDWDGQLAGLLSND